MGTLSMVIVKANIVSLYFTAGAPPQRTKQMEQAEHAEPYSYLFRADTNGQFRRRIFTSVGIAVNFTQLGFFRDRKNNVRVHTHWEWLK